MGSHPDVPSQTASLQSNSLHEVFRMSTATDNNGLQANAAACGVQLCEDRLSV